MKDQWTKSEEAWLARALTDEDERIIVRRMDWKTEVAYADADSDDFYLMALLTKIQR